MRRRGFTLMWPLVTFLALPAMTTLASVNTAAVFPPAVSQKEVSALLEATAFVRGLDEATLVKLVPEQSGLHFVGCPNCTSGSQEGQLAWAPEHPDEVSCRYCGQHYPSAKYPMSGAVTVRNPRGETQRYPYWEDAKSYRYFFQARRDDLVREYLAARTLDLARLYAATGAREYARRVALLLDRFAQVFPGWCYHYDYPFRQKEIYEGAVPPAKFRPNYRTARWTWWAYMDIPAPLVQAYDAIRGSGVFEELSREKGTDVGARIERELFRSAAEQVLGNPEEWSNMDPTCWRSLGVLGRVIDEPRYVHEVVRRLRFFVETRFFYDGAWPEGSPDYAAQTVGGLESVLGVLKGHSDPPGYTDSEDGTRFDRLDLTTSLPALARARTVLLKMRLPNGRRVPINDTWPFSRAGALPATEPYLLPALGFACLGGGAGEHQTQIGLKWSGGYGHQHADSLSLLLFAHGHEMLSDLGYSHTRYRAWTLATAAHNTVVIDGESQSFGGRGAPPTDGTLRCFDASDGRVQVVSARSERGYPGTAKLFQRTLMVIDAGEGRRYAVDLFEVEGGRTHDYFLHGDADTPSSVTTGLKLEPLATLLPSGFAWRPTENESDLRRVSERSYAFGFLRNLHAASAAASAPLPVTFHPPGNGGPGLRITLLPETHSRLIVGENPSIRPAGEDDAKLEQFTRPFMVLRHETGNGRSAFATLLEPYAESPFVTAVERLPLAGARLALRVSLGSRTDFIVCGANRPVRLRVGTREATFSGEAGVLSLRGDAVEHAYVLGAGGTPHSMQKRHRAGAPIRAGGWTRGDLRLRADRAPSLPLRAVDGDALVVEGVSSSLPGAGEVVRLVTEDGWVYPYTVTSAEVKGTDLRLRVAEGPGLTWDPTSQRLRLSAFPQRQHRGAVRLEWTPHAQQ